MTVTIVRTQCGNKWIIFSCECVCFVRNYGRISARRYDGGTGPIWLDDVNCNGTETAIGNCPHNGWGSHNCDHSEDVSITCDNTTTTSGNDKVVSQVITSSQVESIWPYSAWALVRLFSCLFLYCRHCHLGDARSLVTFSTIFINGHTITSDMCVNVGRHITTTHPVIAFKPIPPLSYLLIPSVFSTDNSPSLTLYYWWTRSSSAVFTGWCFFAHVFMIGGSIYVKPTTKWSYSSDHSSHMVEYIAVAETSSFLMRYYS